MNKISIVLIIVGACFLAFGGYQWFQTVNAQNQSMSEAEELLAEKELLADDRAISHADAAKEFTPQTGDTVGILHIPKLAADLPIIEGTHEDELAKGVGHYKGTAYPLEDNQIVLSGHRDTVFRRMGELKIGDTLTIRLPYGDFSYEITETEIVDADDRTIIVPHDEEVLTLTTCYPFSFIGNAPDRYIITALPVSES